MDLNFLDKSSSVMPYLVRLYDNQKLCNMAKDNNPEARLELTSIITGLFEIDLSHNESELVADVLIGLMRQAEKDLRLALSERLAVMDNVPLRLALNIANDEIEVATPILIKNKALSDLDLIYIIKSKTPAYWAKIAQREEMSSNLIDILAETEDIETAHNLVTNDHIKLTEKAMTTIASLAQTNPKLAPPLVHREEITKDIAQKLYQLVGEELKNHISKMFGELKDEPVDLEQVAQVAEITKAVDDIVLDFVDSSKADEESNLSPSQAMENAAQRYADKGLLTSALLINTLKRGQLKEFIAQFALFTGLKSETVTEMVKQKNGQGLAIACRASDIIKQDFVTIFLLTNRARNGASMVNLKDMNRAIGYFDRVTNKTARDILEHSKNTSRTNIDSADI